MATPNLGIAHIAASQNQKEVTVNQAFDALDEAINDSADVDCTAGGTVVLSSADYTRNARLHLVGAPAADFILEVPDAKRLFLVHNESGRSATVQRAGGGAGAIVLDGDVQVLVNTGADLVTAAGKLYDLGFFFGGQPGDLALLVQFVVVRGFTVPAGAAGSQGFAATAPSAAASFDLCRNGASFGTLDFAASSQSGTFTVGAATAFGPGDRLEVVEPSPQDATLADVSVTLKTVR